MNGEHIAATRAFNRLVTQRAGALEVRFLGRGRPLAQTRVLYEIGEAGTELRALRRKLDLDSGYLSRLVHSLVAEGLVSLDADPVDERVRWARLTPAGMEEWNLIDRRSDDAAIEVLRPLTEKHRERLHTAMVEACRLLRLSAVRFSPVDPESDRALGALARYFDELDDRFAEGFDAARSPAPDTRGFSKPDGAFLVATTMGDTVACGGVTRLEQRVAYIKRMWVDPSMRGLGLGRALLQALEAAASELGCETVRLETNRALNEAIQLYRSTGYREVPSFIDEPYAHHWFEKRLTS